LLFAAPGDHSGVDPFASPVDWRGVLTHGHLPENSMHGGAPTSIVDVRKLPNGPQTTEVRIKGYTYRPGDLSLLSRPGARIPTVRHGHRPAFDKEAPPRQQRPHPPPRRAPRNRDPRPPLPPPDPPRRNPVRLGTARHRLDADGAAQLAGDRHAALAH